VGSEKFSSSIDLNDFSFRNNRAFRFAIEICLTLFSLFHSGED
jgi:hypothetical protein